MNLQESVPLHLRQATADQQHSPQRNTENTEWEAMKRFLDMESKAARKEFDYFQNPEVFNYMLFENFRRIE